MRSLVKLFIAAIVLGAFVLTGSSAFAENKIKGMVGAGFGQHTVGDQDPSYTNSYEANVIFKGGSDKLKYYARIRKRATREYNTDTNKDTERIYVKWLPTKGLSVMAGRLNNLGVNAKAFHYSVRSNVQLDGEFTKFDFRSKDAIDITYKVAGIKVGVLLSSQCVPDCIGQDKNTGLDVANGGEGTTMVHVGGKFGAISFGLSIPSSTGGGVDGTTTGTGSGMALSVGYKAGGIKAGLDYYSAKENSADEDTYGFTGLGFSMAGVNFSYGAKNNPSASGDAAASKTIMILNYMIKVGGKNVVFPEYRAYTDGTTTSGAKDKTEMRLGMRAKF